MSYMILTILFLITSCSSFSRNLWLNRFEVCCIVNKSVKNVNKVLEFKDGYFEDEFIKLSMDLDVMEGFKINFISKCDRVGYINWDKSSYIDEYGRKHNLSFSEMSFLNEKKLKNISILPPFMEIAINLIPSDYIYRKGNMWLKKPLFDFKINPQEYLNKNVSINFDYICGENTYNYTIFFDISKRYPVSG